MALLFSHCHFKIALPSSLCSSSFPLHFRLPHFFFLTSYYLNNEPCQKSAKKEKKGESKKHRHIFFRIWFLSRWEGTEPVLPFIRLVATAKNAWVEICRHWRGISVSTLAYPQISASLHKSHLSNVQHVLCTILAPSKFLLFLFILSLLLLFVSLLVAAIIIAIAFIAEVYYREDGGLLTSFTKWLASLF